MGFSVCQHRAQVPQHALLPVCAGQVKSPLKGAVRTAVVRSPQLFEVRTANLCHMFLLMLAMRSPMGVPIWCAVYPNTLNDG